MTPGLCYRITLANGDTEVFKFLGHSNGQSQIEVPAGSGTRSTFEKEYPGAYQAVDEVECPNSDK